VHYSGGARPEKGVAIVVHKSVVRSVVKKIVYNCNVPPKDTELLSGLFG